MLTRSIILCCFLLGMGCANVGRPFESEHAREIKTGQSQSATISWFGEPFQTVTMTQTEKGCVSRWIYKYGTSSSEKTEAKALVVDFDPSGAVCGSAYSEVQQ
jgi:hypothetical protein